ncbi:MAG: glycosyltransferase family 2 protein, partial [Candidatus Omnitrophica bacterium]|nr:glycosyltransferase family 2 protein [Candidatus Omnitrophota bacterium]
PCYNEEKTLPLALKDLPKKIAGIDSLEILVINDGSTDKTFDVARSAKVDHILNLPGHLGLAEAFKRGLERSVELGADIIINTDGDNQYNGKFIPELVKPIIDGKAEIVIGCRDMSAIKHFSLMKKLLQKVGSHFVRKFSDTDIPDTTSGFRAYSRDAALKMNIFSTYTYTLETIIQAGRKKIPMTYVNVTTNEKLRESRLIKSIPAYITRSIATILRIYLMYEPLKSFVTIGLAPIVCSFLLVGRFFYYYFTSVKGSSGHVQSLIIAAMVFVAGLMIIVIGLLGDIISANRKLNEEILYRYRKDSVEKSRLGK